MAVKDYYKVEGDKLVHLKKECPKCGAGVFMAAPGAYAVFKAVRRARLYLSVIAAAGGGPGRSGHGVAFRRGDHQAVGYFQPVRAVVRRVGYVHAYGMGGGAA